MLESSAGASPAAASEDAALLRLFAGQLVNYVRNGSNGDLPARGGGGGGGGGPSARVFLTTCLGRSITVRRSKSLCFNYSRAGIVEAGTASETRSWFRRP